MNAGQPEGRAYFIATGETLVMTCSVNTKKAGTFDVEVYARSRQDEPPILGVDCFDFVTFDSLINHEQLLSDQRVELASLIQKIRDRVAEAGRLPKQAWQHTSHYNRQANCADYADSAELTLEWRTPKPLFEYQVEDFPLDALPSVLERFARAVATSTQTPPDLVASLMLAVLAAALARNVEVQVRIDWLEPLNLYLVTALPPGERKSAVLRHVSAPLIKVEREEIAEYKRLLPLRKSAQRIAEHRLRNTETAATKATHYDHNDAEHPSHKAVMEFQQHVLPPMPRRLVDDATPEAIGELLCQHGRIACLSPEGAEIFALTHRYSSTGDSNFGILLLAHSGDPIRIDRRGRAAELEERPALTLGLTVQPDVLKGLLRNKLARGRGLIARFLCVLPKSLMGQRDCDPTPIAESTADAYDSVIRSLVRISNHQDSNSDQYKAYTLTVGEEARKSHLRFQQWLESESGPHSKFGHMTEWTGKLAGAIARIAGLLHMAEHVIEDTRWGMPISAATMERAITIGRYFLSHAEAAYGQMGADEAQEQMRILLDWICKNRIKEFSARDCFSSIHSRTFPSMKAFRPTLRLAEEYGYIQQIMEPQPRRSGRKGSPRYAVNPIWMPYDSAESTESAE